MSDLLSIGASGVRAYQSALTTVSDNIANAGTAGYSRRTTDLKEVVAPGGAGLTTRVVGGGAGVRAGGVSRQADAYAAANVRSSGADLSRTQTAAAWLDRVQTALTGNALGDRLTGFFTTAKTLAADPTSGAARATMLEAGTSVANAFAGTGAALDGIDRDLDTTADQTTDQLDTLGQALAKVNDGLGRAAPGSAGAAGLADQRDRLLDQISAIADTGVSLDQAGRATVKLGGAGGPAFVSGNQSGNVTAVRNDEGAMSFAVHFEGNTAALVPGGGALAGIADAAERIAAAKTDLGQVASDFVDGVNRTQESGTDLNGRAGAALFAVGDTPTAVTLSLSDPSGIAAAAPGEGKRGNANLAALQAVRGQGAFETRTTALVSANAATLAAKQTVAGAQTSIHDGAVAARDAVSGVNLDTEAVDLLRFQQAYSASSRVIQTARETFQSILDIR